MKPMEFDAESTRSMNTLWGNFTVTKPMVWTRRNVTRKMKYIWLANLLEGTAQRFPKSPGENDGESSKEEEEKTNAEETTGRHDSRQIQTVLETISESYRLILTVFQTNLRDFEAIC